MKRNTRVRINFQDSKCSVINYNNELVESFELADDLDKALFLLKKINQIKTIEGTPLYMVRCIYGYSTWSFHQGPLFWDNLRHYVYFSPVIEYILKNNLIVESPNNQFLNLLKMSGGKVVYNTSLFIKLKITIFNLILGIMAKVIGYLALIRGIIYRPKLLIYSPDKYDPNSRSDFRMKKIYEFLKKQNIFYIEIFHTLLGKEFLSNFIKRKRLGFYLEYPPLASHFSTTNKEKLQFNFHEFKDIEKEYIKNLVFLFDQYCRISALRVKTLKRIFKIIGIKKLVTIDDLRAQEVIAAIKSLGGTAYGFQHGHINQYHAAHMYYGIPSNFVATFDKLFVWNEYWKKMLIKYSNVYNEMNVDIGGLLRPLPEIKFIRKPIPNLSEKVSLLIVNDTWSRRDEVTKYLKKLLNMGANLYLSLRPDIPVKEQIKDYGIELTDQIHSFSGINKEILASVDAVAGVYSTYIREVMYYGLPALAFQTKFKFGYDLVEDKLAYPLKEDFSLEEIIDYIKAAENKKNILWPDPSVTIEETLASILSEYVK